MALGGSGSLDFFGGFGLLSRIFYHYNIASSFYLPGGSVILDEI